MMRKTSEISMLGNTELYLTNERKRIGIVGHRDSDMSERAIAYTLAQQVVEADNIVVSGLAEGVDTFAHVGGRYRTIAVVASLKNIYPKHNKEMFKQILAMNGLCISMSDSDVITPYAFLQRNDLLVDICDEIWAVGEPKGGLGYTLNKAEKLKKKIEYY